jgi:hypothetical protein
MKCGFSFTIQTSSPTVKTALISAAVFKVTCKYMTRSDDDSRKELLLRWCAGKSAMMAEAQVD